MQIGCSPSHIRIQRLHQLLRRYLSEDLRLAHDACIGEKYIQSVILL